MSDANIARTLSEQAAAHPFQMAVAFPSARDHAGRTVYAQLSYRQLEEAAERVARGLLASGIGEGMRTAFMVKPSLEFFILTFALFKARAVPVLIDPGLGIRPIGRCLAEARAEAFVGIPLAHLARRLFRWGPRRWKKLVRVQIGRAGPRWLDPLFGRFLSPLSYADLWEAGGRRRDIVLPEAKAEDLAAVLFTSGSTGAPKGVLYTHANFRAQIELLRSSLGIRQGDIDLCTFPLFALFAPALGMSAVVPEMDFTRPAAVDPEKIREAIETFGVTNMFGSPALVRRVAEYGTERGWTFPSLERVIAAGAPVPLRVIERFRRLLQENCQFFTPYGATESLPVALAESRMLLGETRTHSEKGGGICVGAPVGGTIVKIIRISDAPIESLSAADACAPFEVGEIIVAGPQVTARYDQREEANRLGKIRAASDDPSGASFYHRMGDLGYEDEQGRIWFCGRKSQRVITPAGPMFTIPVESIFNRHPWVARSALIGLGTAPNERAAVCIEVEESRLPLTGVAQQHLLSELRDLAEKHRHTADITTFFLHLHAKFPVDIRHNAKIFREKLKPWAEAQWQKKYSSQEAEASSARRSSSSSSNVGIPSRL